MKTIALLPLVVLTLAAFPGFSGECGKNMFEVRQYDELVSTDGIVHKGRVSENDDGGYTFFDVARGLRQTFTKDTVRTIRKKATPESQLQSLTTEYATNPQVLYCIAVEATTRFSLHKLVIPILERTVAARPDEKLRQLLAKLYIDTAQPDRALRIAEELVKAKPNEARNLMLRGQANALLDHLDIAEKDLVKAFKLNPGDDQIALAYANLLLRTGRAEEAKKMYAETIMANPRSEAALAGLGLVQLRSADFTAAEQSFNQVLAINQNYRDAHVGLATAKLMLKQYDDAYGECNLALNLDPNCAEAFQVQAFCRLFRGDPLSLGDADKRIKDSLEIKPNQPRLILASAVLLDRQAKYEELKNDKERDAAAVARLHQAADAKFNEILGSEAPDGVIQYFIGERRFQEAHEAFRRKENVAYEGSMARANEAFQRAAKIEGGYAPVHAACGAALLELKKWDEARAAFARAAEQDPKESEYLAGQGLAMLNSQKFDEAQDLFNKALGLNPANVAACCGRGYIANWQRDKDRAIANFQKALAADGDCSYAANALQAIYRQDGDDLEYTRFNGTDWPAGWKARSPGVIKLAPANGQAVFSGVQGPAQGNLIELYRDFPNAESFRRLEADLNMLPTSPVEFGLRLASGIGPAPAFEVLFGKDGSNEVKVKFRDAGGAMPAWASTRTEWPASGRVRLSLETDGLKVGDQTVFKLSVNGRTVAEITPKLAQKPGRLTLGMYLTAPPNEKVNATVNNVVIVRKGEADHKSEVTPDVKIIEDKPEKAADDKKPAPAPGNEKTK